jgi:3-phenylpropionate/trans-cinnamate dioxygenase ferredoxin subunit
MNPPERRRIPVCPAAELPPGARRIVEVDGRSIGVFNVGGRLYALHNRCPHRGAPLCEGRLTGLATAERAYAVTWTREGEILRCPWHGWEFDLADGRSVFMPERVRTKTYPVDVERYDVLETGGRVVVLLP